MISPIILPLIILPAGRVNRIIAIPLRKWLANVVFGGASFGELLACSSDKLFTRKTTVKGGGAFRRGTD